MKKIFILTLLSHVLCFGQVVQLNEVNYISVMDLSNKNVLYTKYTIVVEPTIVTTKRLPITKNPQVGKLQQSNRYDYAKSITFDRGHLCPIIDFSFSVNALKTVNYYTNISPQNKTLNRGLWRALEKYIHDTAYSANDPVTVYTGVIYDWHKLKRIQIPTHWYKLVYYGNNIKAYLVPNTNVTQNGFYNFEVSPQILVDIINSYGLEKIVLN